MRPLCGKLMYRSREMAMRKIGLALVSVLFMIGGMSGAATAQPSFGFGFFHGRVICQTDRQIRNTIAAAGYTDISLNVPNDGLIKVRATQGGWVYQLNYNYCRAYIKERMRLRPAG
jgi:hypothetical protein